MMQASQHTPEELEKLRAVFNQRTVDPLPQAGQHIRVCGACGLAGAFIKADGARRHECALIDHPRQGERERARRLRRLADAA